MGFELVFPLTSYIAVSVTVVEFSQRSSQRERMGEASAILLGKNCMVVS